MNYELAKQLYKKGSPFKSDVPVTEANIKYISFPNLSELIAGCGYYGFASLMVSYDGEWKKYFIAKSAPITGSKIGTGKTPEEAVARLWLALNKKRQ